MKVNLGISSSPKETLGHLVVDYPLSGVLLFRTFRDWSAFRVRCFSSNS